MLMSSEAGRLFNMLHITDNHLISGSKNLMRMWMERRGGTESHSTEES